MEMLFVFMAGLFIGICIGFSVGAPSGRVVGFKDKVGIEDMLMQLKKGECFVVSREDSEDGNTINVDTCRFRFDGEN